MSSVEKYLKASEFFKEMASFLSTCGETEFLDKLEYLKYLKEQWMLNETVPLQSKSYDIVDAEDTLVQTIVVETGPNISSESDVINGQSEDLNTVTETNETTETSKDCLDETSETIQTNKDFPDEAECSVTTGTCSSDSKNNESFRPVDIPPMKSRIGRPKGTNKPFWEFCKSKRPLSLKKMKRKSETNEASEKRQRSDDETIDFSQEKEVITIVTDNELDADTIVNNNSWIKSDNVSLNVDSKTLIESGEMLDNMVIEVAQTILNTQFPGINGFQPTVLGQVDISFTPLSKDMVQIHFKGNNQCGHWFTISTLNMKPGYVSIYDRLNLDPDSQVKNQICAILKHEGTTVTVNKVPVQQQHGSVDCGLFATANSVALCFGHEPNKLLFRQDRMRNHFL